MNTRVYLRHDSGKMELLTPHLAAQALADFWEDRGHHYRKDPMELRSGVHHPGEALDGKKCTIVTTDGATRIGSVTLAASPFIQVDTGHSTFYINVRYITGWSEIPTDEDGHSA